MVRARVLTGIVLGGLALAGCEHRSDGAAALSYGASAVDGAGNTVILALDPSAQRRAREAELRALQNGRTGMPISWRNGKVRGEVVPGPRYQVNAYNCRDYVHTVYGEGQPLRVRGTACRQPNGTWQSVS